MTQHPELTPLEIFLVHKHLLPTARNSDLEQIMKHVRIAHDPQTMGKRNKEIYKHLVAVASGRGNCVGLT